MKLGLRSSDEQPKTEPRSAKAVAASESSARQSGSSSATKHCEAPAKTVSHRAAVSSRIERRDAESKQMSWKNQSAMKTCTRIESGKVVDSTNSICRRSCVCGGGERRRSQLYRSTQCALQKKSAITRYKKGKPKENISPTESTFDMSWMRKASVTSARTSYVSSIIGCVCTRGAST